MFASTQLIVAKIFFATLPLRARDNCRVLGGGWNTSFPAAIIVDFHSTRHAHSMVQPGRLPFSISVDKNAAYQEAFTSSQAERILPRDCKLRRVKYLNNVTRARPQVRQKEGASFTIL